MGGFAYEGSIEQGPGLSRVKAESILQGLSAIKAVHVARFLPTTHLTTLTPRLSSLLQEHASYKVRERRLKRNLYQKVNSNKLHLRPLRDSVDDSEATLTNPRLATSHTFDTAIKLAFLRFLRTAEFTCESKDLENKPVFE
jgi:hypothetical protein